LKKALLVIVAMVMLLAMFAGCNNQSTPEPTASSPSATTTGSNPPAATTNPNPNPAPGPDAEKMGGDLKVALLRNPVAFGYPPQLTASDRNVATPMFERLLYVDDDLNYQPELATEWSFSEDGLTLTFKLRQGVKYHDGTDFNAQSAKDNFEELIPPKARILPGITSVNIIDPYTISFTLSEYNNLILYQIASSYEAYMCSYDAVRANGAEWARTHPVGTGPFMLDDYEPDNYVRLVRNPNYWRENRPFLDSYTWVVITDGTTQLLSYQAREVDGVFDVQPANAASFKDGTTEIVTAPLAVFCMAMDTANNPALADVRVRQAIEYAIDKEAISKGPGMGYYVPAYQVIPTDSVYYNPACTPRKYDPAKARALLEEAGYANGLTIEYNGLETYWRDGMVAVQAYLADVGIDLKINYLPQAAYNAIRSNSEIPPGNASQMTMTIFANNLYVLDQQWRANPSTFAFIQTPVQCDALLTAAKASRDQAESVRIAQQVVKILYDDVTVIPLWINPRLNAIRDYVIDHGFIVANDANNVRAGVETWLNNR